MGAIGKSANIRVLLDDIDMSNSIDLSEGVVEAVFSPQASQSSINIDNISFFLIAYDYIIQKIEEGLTGGDGIFQGISFRIEAFNNVTVYPAFEGYVSTKDVKIFDWLGRLEAPVIKLDSFDSLQQKVKGVSVGYVHNQGFFKPNDFVPIKYNVKAPFDPIQSIIISITLYTLVKELIQFAKDIPDQLSTISSIAAAGITGAIGAAIYAIAIILIQAIYLASILLALVALGDQLFQAVFSPLRTHQAVILKRVVLRVAEYLGLGLETTFNFPDQLVYLPSNIAYDQPNAQGFLGIPGVIEVGIPNAQDYGYNVSEVLDRSG